MTDRTVADSAEDRRLAEVVVTVEGLRHGAE
jgi:hypothetical protein